MMGSCEHGYETSGYRKCTGFLDRLLAFQQDQKWTHTEKNMGMFAPPCLIIL
jgi:hypothetical protein